MNTIRLIHFINSIISGVTGVIVSLILVYLILKKTVKEMKQYSHILLQSTVLDLFLAITSIFVDIVRKFASAKTSVQQSQNSLPILTLSPNSPTI
jgi:hypothetical protein